MSGVGWLVFENRLQKNQYLLKFDEGSRPPPPPHLVNDFLFLDIELCTRSLYRRPVGTRT